jgi:flagellar biogenesis protein FliO
MRAVVISALLVCCGISNCCWALEAPPESIETSKEAFAPTASEDDEYTRALPNFRAMLVKTVLLLGGIVGMLLTGSYVIKKVLGGRVDAASSQGTIRLVGRTYLSPKTCLWLVEVQDQHFAIIDSPHGVALHIVPTQKKEDQGKVE